MGFLIRLRRLHPASAILRWLRVLVPLNLAVVAFSHGVLPKVWLVRIRAAFVA